MVSAIGSVSVPLSNSRPYHTAKRPHQPSYGQPKNNNNDYVTETHYDQYGDAHTIKFKKGDYSKGCEGGRTFTMNPDESYDSDDGNIHFKN